MATASQLKRQFVDALFARDEVIAVGVDDRTEEVVVTIREGSRAQFAGTPSGLPDGRVRVEERDEFVAEILRLTAPQSRTGTQRPVLGGVSAGHGDITAGTVGFLIEDDGGNRYTVSNNHVYAAANQGEPGDAIYQPGPIDEDGPLDQSATLTDYVPIEAGAVIDLAWGEPTTTHLRDLLDLGQPRSAPRDASVGDELTKSGRTTAVTTGTVEQVEASVQVGYGDPLGAIRFDDQIITGSMSQGGDSGSAVLFADDHAPAGLLFAGSSTSTVISPAKYVESKTGMSIVTSEPDRPEAQVTLTLTPTDTGPESGDLRVLTREEGGGPFLEGVTVAVSGPEQREGVTDDQGHLLFEQVPIGSYTIEASADGYETATASIDVDDFQ